MKYIILPALLFALPVVAAATHLLLMKQKRFILIKINQLAFCVLLLLLSFYLFFLSKSLIIVHVGSWPVPYGICLVFDNLTKLMLLIFSIVIFFINIFSLQDDGLNKQYSIFYIGAWLLTLGIIGILSTYDVFNLYVWVEVTLVSAFIVLSINQSDNASCIYHYAIFNITGTLLMLLAIALLYGMTGNLNYAAIAKFLQTKENGLALPIITLFLLGLSVKGGVFPFYFWLPSAYPKTSNSSTMLLSSLVTKVIMLAILRFFWLWRPLQSTSIILLFIFLACCTMFFGVMGAVNDYKIRNILTFHIISQLGYVLLAIFIPTSLAIIAALYFLIHNIFVKTNLLMTAGIIEQQYKTGELDRLGNILKACPLLGGIFFISAMSLAGFPPLSGFWGKLLIFKAAFNNQFYIALFFAILVSLFTLYSMIKIWWYAYCQPAEVIGANNEAFKLTKTQLSALLPMLLIPLLFGLYPNFILPTLKNIAVQLNNPQAIINNVMGEIK